MSVKLTAGASDPTPRCAKVPINIRRFPDNLPQRGSPSVLQGPNPVSLRHLARRSPVHAVRKGEGLGSPRLRRPIDAKCDSPLLSSEQDDRLASNIPARGAPHAHPDAEEAAVTPQTAATAAHRADTAYVFSAAGRQSTASTRRWNHRSGRGRAESARAGRHSADDPLLTVRGDGTRVAAGGSSASINRPRPNSPAHADDDASSRRRPVRARAKRGKQARGRDAGQGRRAQQSHLLANSPARCAGRLHRRRGRTDRSRPRGPGEHFKAV